MTDVIMPQMGESIAEGTITKWMKNVGDKVERDEPLFEISTDKVDAEIPSPAAGVLQEIRVEAGATVPINTVVGVIAAKVGQKVLEWLSSIWVVRVQIATTLLILGMGVVLTVKAANQLASLPG